MHRFIMRFLLRSALIVSTFTAVGFYFISSAKPSEINDDSLLAMSAFFNRPSILLMHTGQDTHPDASYSYRWMRDGRDIQYSNLSMLNISIDELLGVVNEEIKGCVIISPRPKASIREHCTIYRPTTITENNVPPDATLFTYIHPKYTLNAKYYYHSSRDISEGATKFSWVIKKRNGFIGLIKDCKRDEECRLNISDDMARESVGVLVQPVDQQGTIGRGDIKWYYINNNKKAIAI